MLTSRSKHYLHCTALFALIVVFEAGAGGLGPLTRADEPQPAPALDPWAAYGLLGALFLYLARYIVLLPLPQVTFNFLGLTYYNAFPDKVALNASPLLAPFISFRVVTRGDYVELVRANVRRNMRRCVDAGLENFQIEVVSDKPLGLERERRLREVVVPKEYKTRTGALFKARALQYCLEEGVNELGDSDWIVHLDEETLLTENSIRGVLNFVSDGRHKFGQGLITYANEEVVNWITTLADCFRVSDDMGKLRFQFRMFHKPLFSWKGSFVVSQVAAERDVSFDNGLDGSIAEDCFFAMSAFHKGYTFNFIEGDMWEKSPFTLMDFIQQRKRWLQGILLVVHSKQIPIKYRLLLACSCYSWLTLPISVLNVYLLKQYPLPVPIWMDFIVGFVGAINVYMFIFGIVKSFTIYRFGLGRFILCLVGVLVIMPFNLCIENVAVLWGIFGKKHKFYVVDKRTQSTIIV